MKYLAIIIVLLPASVWAQTAITVSSSASMTNVLRMGLDLEPPEQYFPEDFMQNMLPDPGFEPGMESHIAIVATSSGGATSGTFTDAEDHNERGTGYWVGAAGSVRTGPDAGATFTVTSFTAGGTYGYGSCSPSCSSLGLHDGLNIVLKGTTIANPSGYWKGADANFSISLGSPYEGLSSARWDVSDGNSHSIFAVWDDGGTAGGVCSSDNLTFCTAANVVADCGSGPTCLTAPASGPWHPVVGSFEMDFFAKATNTSSGTPQVTVTLARSGGTNVTHTFNLTNDSAYHQYHFAFTGGDTVASRHNILQYTIAVQDSTVQTGATIYVDDVYLGRTGSSTTGFRQELIDTLNGMKVGMIRHIPFGGIDMDGPTFEGLNGGATSCTPGAVGVQGYVSGGCDYLKGMDSYMDQFGGPRIQWNIAADDFYALANATNSVPMITLPNLFNDTDLKGFIDRVCTALSTYNFPSIWVEQSNEDWNSSGGDVHYGGNYPNKYGAQAGRNFYIMSTEAVSQCSTLASRIHYIVGNQESNNGVITNALNGAAAQTGCPGATTCNVPNTSQYGSDDATYNGGSDCQGQIPSKTGTILSQAAQYATYYFADPTACHFGGNNWFNNDAAAVHAINSNNTFSVYETQFGQFISPGTTEQAYLGEAAFPSAAEQALTFLLGTQALAPLQGGYNEGFIESGSGSGSPIWAYVRDLDSDFGGTFPHLRPTGLGEEILNIAIGGSYTAMPGYYSTSGAPAGVFANAYKLGTAWSAALVNSNSSSSSVQLQFPSGTVPSVAKAVLFTNNIADNNENSASVFIGALPGGTTVSGQNVTMTLPGDSVVSVTQPTGGGASGPGLGGFFW